MNERRIRQVFEISVLQKGAHALIECIGGLVLAFISTSAIANLVNALTQEELIEDPNDFVAAHLLDLAHNFSVGTQHFYAFYLLSHGVVKVFLVVGLLRNKVWAYPVSLVVLGLFIVYQLPFLVHAGLRPHRVDGLRCHRDGIDLARIPTGPPSSGITVRHYSGVALRAQEHDYSTHA